MSYSKCMTTTIVIKGESVVESTLEKCSITESKGHNNYYSHKNYYNIIYDYSERLTKSYKLSMEKFIFPGTFS